MPSKFDDMVNAVRKSMKGKVNPKTKKPYTNSDFFAIATGVYKKKYGKSPQENEEVVVAENVRVSFNSYLEVQE